MKLNNVIVFLSILTIIVVLINISVIFIKISEFEKELNGQVTGYVNLTVQTYVFINISRDSINWSTGAVNNSFLNATIYTSGDNSGVVSRGNWSGSNAKAIVVENLGSSNCSVYIQTGKNAHDLFNSASSSNEEYKLNVSNKEASSCSGGTATLGQWTDVNKTSGGTKYCGQFDFHNDNNEIYIDVLLTVPRDSNNVGELSDTITVIGDAV